MITNDPFLIKVRNQNDQTIETTRPRVHNAVLKSVAMNIYETSCGWLIDYQQKELAVIQTSYLEFSANR